MVKRSSFLLLLLSLACTAFTQDFDSLLLIQRRGDPQEKIHVHFDKSYYNPGETIWFKAYLFSGFEPSLVSRNFYAELTDEQGIVISQKTAPVVFAGANSHFDIDSAFSKPAVYFRAYTVNMLNGDTGFLYNKQIRILTAKTPPAKSALTTSQTTLSLLPEGGDLVEGIACTVAFKATNEKGLPVTVSGSVTDNTGAKVADLKTLFNGMGSFTLLPQAGKTYTATWKAEGGKQNSTALPIAKREGVVLKIAGADNGKRFIIHRTPEAGDALKQLHVIAFMNQQLMFKADIDLRAKTTASGTFPTSEIPSGILQVTVFDKNYKPLAERVSFVNNRDYEFDGDVFVAQKDFTRRGLNKVEVSISDTVPASLSLSIVDADLNEKGGFEDNIVSRLLLTGDLRGKIADPYYYFFSTADSAALHLDLVMQTHGWRRYNWEQVLAGKVKEPRWRESNYLSLNGQITGLPPGSFSSDLQLTGILQTADSARTILMLPVDRKGQVATEGLVFYDNAKLFFNFNKKTLSFDKSMLLVDNGLRKGYTKISLDSMIRKETASIQAATIAANNNVGKKLLQLSRQLAMKGIMDNITVTAKTKTSKEKMEEKYVSSLFSGDGTSFDLVNDPSAAGFMNIFQYLQGRVAGLQITGGGMSPSLSWRGGTPVLYLNEMQSDINMIASTPVSDIAYIKVLRPGAGVVAGSGNGVIAVYTRRGGDTQPDPNAKRLSFVQMTGYSPQKQFYSPDYATFSERDAYDDVRTTLYWNPSIFLDKGRRKLRFQFYNNDITKRFRLVLEGINADGKLIHVEKETGN